MDVRTTHTPWWDAGGTAHADDGTPLAYLKGGPKKGRTLICSNGVGVSTFFWDHVARFFRREHQMIAWDYRGHGSSGIPADPTHLTMKHMAEDLARVLDANEVDQAVLLGHSMGCQVILEFAHLFPKRVLGLVPMLGASGRPFDTFLDPRIGIHVYKGLFEMGTKYPELVSRFARRAFTNRFSWPIARLSGLIHPDLCTKEELTPYLEHLSTMDIRVFVEMLRAAQEHDASSYLAQIVAPTLVVAAERDRFTPHVRSQEMVRALPNAEMLEIPLGSHAALVEQPELINLRLERFLQTKIKAPKKKSK